MEQPRKRERGERHGHGKRKTRVALPNKERGHRGHGDERTFDDDLPDQPPVEQRRFRIARLLAQKIVARGLHADSHSGQTVGEQVDEQQMHRRKGRSQSRDRGEQHTHDACHVARQQKVHGVLDIGVHAATVHDGLHDGGEVVVREDHRSRIFADLGSGDAHGNSDVGLFERRRVVHAVACHRHDATAALPRVHDAYFMLRRHARVHRDVRQNPIELRIVHLVELHASDGAIPLLEDADLARNGGGRDLMVPCDHDGTDASLLRIRNRLHRFRPRRVHHRREPDECEAVLVVERERTRFGKLPLREGEHAQSFLGQTLVHA